MDLSAAGAGGSLRCPALPESLELTPSDCLRVAVGKRAGAEAVPQAEINRLLMDYGQRINGCPSQKW